MRRLTVAAIAAIVAVVLWTPLATAAPATKTLGFPLSGNSTTNIFNKPFACCAIHIGDPINFDGNIHGALTLDMGAVMSAPTHNDLKYDDANLRQGNTLDLTNTFAKDAGTFNVNYTLGVDLNVYGLDFNPTKSAGDTLSCGLPLLTETCSHTKNVNIASFTVLDLGVAYAQVDVSAALETTADMTGDGVSSERTMTTQNVPIVDPATLHFTSSPQTKDETTFLSCSLPAGDQVNYAMGNESSHVNGTVQEGVGIGVGGSVYARDIPPLPDIFLFGIGPYNFHLFDLPAVQFNQIALTAPAQNVDLGVLQKNNIPPRISTVTSGGTMVEGQDVTWTAGVSSPCGADSLHTEWHFSNPNDTKEMVAYGQTAHIVFPDNGIYEGYVKTTDPTGLSTTKDLTPFTIANANPVVDPVDKHAEWGDVIKYHVDAFDSKADQSSLAFEWTFGDGAKANGQDVEHAFAAPGNYAGSVQATDKDGGVGSGGFHTLVDKRSVTLVYTGARSALTKTSPTLSATLADDHGQPVNGGQVDFTLGGQAISAIVDSDGKTSVLLPLNQAGDVTYPLGATYGGNALYLANNATLPTTFRINKRATTVTYLGDLDQRPNHVTLLSARVVDELGQPVVGANVVFTLGAQSISALTDSTGLASAALTLNQGPGAYVLKAAYAGDSLYLAGSAGAMTFSIPRNTGVTAVAAIAAAGRTSATNAVAARVGTTVRHKTRHANAKKAIRRRAQLRR